MPRLTQERLRRVRLYIRKNIDRPIRLADMADVANMSPFAFTRSFKVTTGLTPLRYVWAARIELAKNLLATEWDMAIAMVAFNAGFTTQSHLNELFARYIGITPRAWRAAAIAGTLGAIANAAVLLDDVSWLLTPVA